jgi:hypothetical protein
MKKQEKPRKATVDPTECPTAWFAVLERARLTEDYERAAHAQRELARLGVRVRFTSREPPQRREIAHAP